MNHEEERGLAALYAMSLREKGYTTREAAIAVVRRYPNLRPEFARRGLVPAKQVEQSRLFSNDVSGFDPT